MARSMPAIYSDGLTEMGDGIAQGCQLRAVRQHDRLGKR
jgi:hypothetical protein